MPQELSYKHPDGWVITTQNFSEGQTDINSPTKSEPSGWVNVPNIDPYQGLVKVEQLDVNSLSAITANMGSITSGTITMDADGYIAGGQTAYNIGSGFWLGFNSTYYMFSIGDSNNNLTWNGVNLAVNGQNINAENLLINNEQVNTTATELNLGFSDNVTFTYNADGTLATIINNTPSSPVTYTMSYSNGLLSSFTDGTRTWTITRTNGNITSLIKS